MKTNRTLPMLIVVLSCLPAWAAETHIDRKPAVIAPPVYIEPSDSMSDILRISTSDAVFADDANEPDSEMEARCQTPQTPQLDEKTPLITENVE